MCTVPSLFTQGGSAERRTSATAAPVVAFQPPAAVAAMAAPVAGAAGVGSPIPARAVVVGRPPWGLVRPGFVPPQPALPSATARPRRRRLPVVSSVGAAGSSSAAAAAVIADRVRRLVEAREAAAVGAVAMPVEGLSPAGLARRGAPWTFDGAAFVAALSTLRTSGQLLDAPSFDHRLGDPVRGGASIGPDVLAVIVEGNYLLIEDATDVQGEDEGGSEPSMKSAPVVAEQAAAAASDAGQNPEAQPSPSPLRTRSHPPVRHPAHPLPPVGPPPTAGPISTAAHAATAAPAATRPTLGAAEAAGVGGDGRVWASVKPLLDEVWYLDTPLKVAMRRVVGRHRRVAGLSRTDAVARVATNDARNAAIVSRSRGRADAVWTPGEGVTELCRPGETTG
ncbi:hypothetical protein MMPV_005349 [Pyropia vietnamensis]